MTTSSPQTERPQVGTVYLVGSGPGDPGLLTWRGIQCLRKADVVLYDYLSNPELLSYLNPTTERHCLGSHAERKLWTQAQINAEMVAQAKQGKTVVRLKSGDPTIFARAADEFAALRKADIPFQIVPGITAALAASAYAGITLTDAQHASAVAFVTGHEKPGKEDLAIDFEALARFPGTLVFYMGVTTAPQWSAQLIEHGKSKDTPCAIIRRCSWPDQETFRCTLGEIAGLLHSGSKIRPPVITLVGEVAADRSLPNWFEERPLFGHSFVVTRPEHQAADLHQELSELGAEVILQPTIDIAPAIDLAPLDEAIRNLKSFAWIAFSSVNGVTYFIDRLKQLGFDYRQLGHIKFACIGPGTAGKLAEVGFHTDVLPVEYRAESLVEAMAQYAKGKQVLLVRASRGRNVLPHGLTQQGANVTEVVAYESRDVEKCSPEVERRLTARGVDWVIVTSSAIAKAAATLMPDALQQSKIVSISPITSDTLRELGYEPVVEAKVYTMPGIVEAILEHVSTSKKN